MGLEAIICRHYKQLVIILLLLNLILQAYNMFFLHWPDTPRRDTERGKVTHKKVVVNSLLADLVRQVRDAHKMDTSGSYVILPNILTPESSNNSENLTVCSHSTLDNLDGLHDLTETWQGPVSVSVFALGSDLNYALNYLASLSQCFEHIRKQVFFHLVYPMSATFDQLTNFTSLEINCKDIQAFTSLKTKYQKNYELGVPYPHNVLRNVAVSFSFTPYILMLDIDIVPSADLKTQFAQFVARKGGDSQKVVYVLPAFESQNSLKVLTKESLKSEWKLKSLHPFYARVCAKCQVATDYDKWLDLPKISFLDVAYLKEWTDPWEPFYIALKQNLPLYDGRFKQYGFNRISQVCELHIAGYQFAVLNNAFVSHKGFKDPEKFHSEKNIENDRNRELFRTFKQELKNKYPDSNRQC